VRLSPPSTTLKRHTISSDWYAGDAGNITIAASPHRPPAIADPVHQYSPQRRIASSPGCLRRQAWASQPRHAWLRAIQGEPPRRATRATHGPTARRRGGRRPAAWKSSSAASSRRAAQPGPRAHGRGRHAVSTRGPRRRASFQDRDGRRGCHAARARRSPASASAR
jgi:hypothetical protein